MAEADTVLPAIQDGPQPPAPIEIDIESGEVADAGTPPPAPAAAPPKNAMPRPQARIRELSEEVRQSKSYAQQVEEELRKARQEAAQERTAREQAERAGMENYAGRVKADLDAAGEELRRAKEANDTTAEVAAQTKLAKAAAADSDVEAWRATLPKAQPQQEPQQQQAPQQQPRQVQQFQPLPQDVHEFIQDNPWFDAIQRDADGRPMIDQRTGQFLENPDFDPELHDAAMLVDKRIQRQIKRGEKPKDYAATPEYFQEIKDAMVQQFPDLAAEEEQPQPQVSRQRTPPMAAARQPVAPASRSGMQGQNNGTKPSTKVRLNSDEVELVNRMVDSGSMKYSRQHPDVNKRGQKMEYKDAYLEYAKRANETRQPNN